MTTTTLDDPLTLPSTDTSTALPATEEGESGSDMPVASDTPTTEPAAEPTASQESTAPPASNDDDDDEEDEDPVLSLERDATDFDKATITTVITLLPHDGHADGRLVLLGVKSHNLPPLTVTRRLAQLTPLPKELEELLMHWQHHFQEALAARTSKRAADKAKEKAKEEERKRKQDESRRTAKTKPATKTTPTRPITKAAATPSAHPVAPAAPPAEAVPQSSLF